MTVRSFVLLAMIMFAGPAAAQRAGGAPPSRPVRYLTAEQLRALDVPIEQARAQWDIPGLAVTIVQATPWCGSRDTA